MCIAKEMKRPPYFDYHPELVPNEHSSTPVPRIVSKGTERIDGRETYASYAARVSSSKKAVPEDIYLRAEGGLSRSFTTPHCLIDSVNLGQVWRTPKAASRGRCPLGSAGVHSATTQHTDRPQEGQLEWKITERSLTYRETQAEAIDR